MSTDHKSVKKTDGLISYLTLLGSECIIAGCKMLWISTLENKSSYLQAFFNKTTICHFLILNFIIGLPPELKNSASLKSFHMLNFVLKTVP